jgi:tRNA U55 pseudouridine synthase TruB
VPSSVSAIKVNGQRAYKLTRAGEAPELAARPVTVYEFRVTATREAGDFLDVDATVRCSSGTYIRALARDLGAALGAGGHLTALRRTAVGPYTLAQARTLEDLQGEDQTDSPERLRLTPDAPAPSQQPGEAHAPGAPLAAGEIDQPEASAPGAPRTVGAPEQSAPTTRPAPAQSAPAAPVVIPLAAAAAAAFPRLDLTADDARRLAQGARLPLPPAPPASLDGGDAPVAAFAPDGTLVALVTADNGCLRSLAVFAGQS